MLDQPQTAKTARFIRERRACARRPPHSRISVALDEWNDGVVFNLSEAGLALSTAGALPDGQFHAMRVQLDGSGGRLVASGQIVWKSSSRKQAGVRFLNLTDEARLYIRKWISAPAPPASSPQPNRAPNKPQALGPDPFERPPASTSDWTGSGPIVERGDEGNSSSLAPIAGAQSRLDDHRTLSPGTDRRARARTRIVPLGYIQVGDGNGGIAFNVSEEGVAITAAMVIGEDHLPSLRLQFPDADDWIETSGQIVWRSESGKEAGVRFVDLTGKAQQQLRTWIQAQEPATAAMQKPIDPTEAEQHPQPEFSYALNREIANPFSYGITSDSMTEDWAENSPASPEPSVFPDIVDRRPGASAPEPVQVEPPFLKTLERRSILEYPGIRKWAALALAVLLGVVSWTLMRTRSTPDVQTPTLAAMQQDRPARQDADHNTPSLAPTISSPTAGDAVPPDDWVAEGPASPTASGPPTQGQGTLPEPQPSEKETSIPNTSANSPQQTVAAKPSPAIPFRPARTLGGFRPALKDVPASTPTPVLRVVPGNLNKTAANNVPPPSVESLAATQSQLDKIAPVVNSSPLPPRYTPPLELKDRGSSKTRAGTEPPTHARTPANFVGSVAVRANPYPAIRMSAENALKKSKKAARLQLGHLVSRVEPTYPDEARQRGIEGTVTVHAIIGKNGAVESVAVLNGPPLLAPAVMNAVRQWRYSETLLAGQPVETEDDITVTFQLSSPAVSQR